MTRDRLSNIFAYASLASALSFWVAGALSFLQLGLHRRVPGLTWVFRLPGWKWELVEAFALLLAIAATVLRSKLWRIALPVALVMLLLINYVMAT